MVFMLSLARPILLPRVLAWTAVPLCVLGGSQLFAAGRARYAVLLACVAPFWNRLVLPNNNAGQQQGALRESMRDIAPQLKRADLVC